MTDSYDGVLSLAPSGDGGVYAAGSFTGAGDLISRNLIKWTGSEWEALGQGVGYGSISGRVEALAADARGLVYAGGYFDRVAGQPASNIAVWEGSRWSGLGAGVNGSVFAPAAHGSTVYVGGSFTEAGGVGASYIAQYNSTTGRWSALDSGVTGYVYALAVAEDGTLFVGGDFTAAGDADTAYIAQWNGRRWAGLGKGVSLDDDVRALAWDGRNLYMGGSFRIDKEGADDVAVNGLLAWDSETDDRYVIGQGDQLGVTRRGSFGDDFGGEIYALALTERALYVGGIFDKAGGVAAKEVAAFHFKEGWQALGDSVSKEYNPAVYALSAAGDSVVVGGEFTAAGTAKTASIARWDEIWGSWQALGDGLNADASVRALALFDGSVYVGGQFVSAGGAPAAAFARWGPPASEEVVRPQIRGRASTPTSTRTPTRTGVNPTPTPCPTRAATGQPTCGRPSRR